MAKARLVSNTDPEIRGKSDVLVVVLHGIGRDLKDWCEAVREFLPDADLLVPQYDSNIVSNVDPRRVAAQLVEYIHEVDINRSKRSDGGEYESIILIGYSGGGLIIRKIYLIAMGYGDDEEIIRNFKPFPWAKKVERILLMAGLNRGISNTKPEHMSWLFYAIQKLGWVALPRLGIGKFVSHLKQGSPFVANLRVQWIRLSQSPDVQLPPTIQLLGDVDEVVSEADNIDVLTDAGFKYLKIRDTGHASICDFKNPAVGSHRKERFHHALTTPIESLDNDSIPYENEVGQAKDHIVFVMHGIRDMGLWTSRIGETVESVAHQLGQSVDCIKAGYGYFPMLRFLFLGSRQVNVRWFMDRYTEVIARYPNSKISFIGHSNGTYLLASALKRYHACKIHHVAFAGSVVPKNYPWDNLIQQGRVKAIRNDVASADWVVGIFPGFFELLKLSDIGTAGHNGFQDDAPKNSSFGQYFKGDHGAAIQPANHGSLAYFILTGNKVAPEEGLLVNQQSSCVVMLAKLCWLVWLLIFVVVGSLGFLSTWILTFFGIPLILTWLIYGVFVLLLLCTL
jgi:predicted esterase